MRFHALGSEFSVPVFTRIYEKILQYPNSNLLYLVFIRMSISFPQNFHKNSKKSILFCRGAGKSLPRPCSLFVFLIKIIGKMIYFVKIFLYALIHLLMISIASSRWQISLTVVCLCSSDLYTSKKCIISSKTCLGSS